MSRDDDSGSDDPSLDEGGSPETHAPLPPPPPPPPPNPGPQTSGRADAYDASAGETADPSTDKSPIAARGSHWRWIALAISVASLGAIGIVGYLYTQAVSDKDDAHDVLATSQADLIDTNELLATSKQAVSDLGEQLEEAESELDEATLSLAETEVSLADTEAQLDNLDGTAETFTRLSLEFFGGNKIDVDCMMGIVSPEAFLVSGIVSMDPGEAASIDPDLLGEVAAGEFACGTTFVGFGPGDSAALDSLYDACAAGDGAACDTLYVNSGLGTEYERFGATCGDRFTVFEAPLECAGEI